MNSFTSIIMSVMTFVMTLIAPLNAISVKENKSDFKPVVRFAVMSDTHISTFGDTRSYRVQKAVSLAYEKADECESYKKLDGVMFCGDITNGGTKFQFDSFVSTVNSVIKDGTQLMAITASAHDNSKMGKECRNYLSSLTGLDADWHYVINGYHFIGLSTSPEEGVRYTEEQIQWVDEELAKAVEADPEKPVFFTHHEHVSDTVYGSADGEWGVDSLKSVFEKYPQVVHFSGHSHYPLNDPRSIWQEDFTCIGTGAITYMEFTVDGESRIHPDNYKKTGQFWLVEADKDGNIRLRGYDVHGENLLCEYILKNPSEKANRTYNADSLKNSKAPAFADGAALRVSQIGGNAAVTVPKAESTDGKPVFIYRVYSYDKSGELIDSGWCLNNYWTSPCYEEIKIKVKSDKEGYISAVAENAYGMQSNPLEYGNYPVNTDDVLQYDINGSTLTFTLKESAGTGYEWKCNITEGDCIRLISSDVKNMSAAGVAGGAINRIFVFESTKDGTAKAELKYARSWETTDYDITIIKTVNVKDGVITVS